MKLMQISVVVMFSLCLSLDVAHASGDLSVSGTTTTKNLTITNVNCTTMANGGALTADAAGVVSCSDDDAGGSLDAAYDHGGAGAGRTIITDSGAVSIQGADGLELDTGSLKQLPGNPILVGSVAVSSFPESVVLSGRYAYVPDSGTNELKVVDISNPAAPSLTDSFGIGDNPVSVYVSGRYAYVVDTDSDDLKVIDVSDPANLSLADSLSIGTLPSSVFVSGNYAYVVDFTDDIKVIDVSDPSAISLVGSLVFGMYPKSVYVSGRYAYVADFDLHELKVIDISGAEFTSLVAHSLEAGNLQVRNDLIAQGQLQVAGGVNVGVGGIFTDGNVGVSGTIAIANDVLPTSSPANLVQLYARDEKDLSELVVLNEAGIHTTSH